MENSTDIFVFIGGANMIFISEGSPVCMIIGPFPQKYRIDLITSVPT